MKDFKKKINGHDYYLVQWDAMKALKIQLELVEMFGEQILNQIATQQSKNLVSLMAVSLAKSVSKCDNQKVIDILENVVKTSIRDGERINSIQTTYSTPEEIAEMYAVFVWVLQANYSDFFVLAKDIFSDPENWSV